MREIGEKIRIFFFFFFFFMFVLFSSACFIWWNCRRIRIATLMSPVFIDGRRRANHVGHIHIQNFDGGRRANFPFYTFRGI